jgi:hypothetical protein
MQRWITGWLAAAVGYTLAGIASAQPKDTIYDEAQVPAYTLPDPLVTQDGNKVADADAWKGKRRPEILRLFDEHVYGRCPKAQEKIAFEVTSLDANALGGKATRKEVAVFLTGKRDGPRMDLLLYLPNAASKPVPAFLGLNFYIGVRSALGPGV